MNKPKPHYLTPESESVPSVRWRALQQLLAAAVITGLGITSAQAQDCEPFEKQVCVYPAGGSCPDGSGWQNADTPEEAVAWDDTKVIEYRFIFKNCPSLNPEKRACFDTRVFDPGLGLGTEGFCQTGPLQSGLPETDFEYTQYITECDAPLINQGPPTPGWIPFTFPTAAQEIVTNTTPGFEGKLKLAPGECRTLNEAREYSRGFNDPFGDAAPAGPGEEDYRFNSVKFSDPDPAYVNCDPQPDIDIEKATNGVDADDPNAGDAPQVVIGGDVTWTYVVTNTGNTTLDPVSVRDDAGTPGFPDDDFCTPNDPLGECVPAISCEKSVLIPGESMDCYTAVGVAVDLTGWKDQVDGQCGSIPGQPLYENMATVAGESNGEFVYDEDPSHYCNPPQPAIDIEKFTNNFQADQRDGPDEVPRIAPDGLVTWRYEVTNIGNEKLVNVRVVDDEHVAGTPPWTRSFIEIECEKTAPFTLDPGEVVICTAEGIAEDLEFPTTITPVPGTCGGIPNSPMYENRGRAFGFGEESGTRVSDRDPSHYCNPPGECELEVNKTCLVIPPPQPDEGVGSCEKPIDVLKLEYANGKTVDSVAWYSGEVAPGNLIRFATSTEVVTLNAGGVVEFDGFEVNDSPNDVQMVTTFDDNSSVVSEFHLSCSDSDMDGPEDCGKVIGDGKSNDLAGSSNIWTFRGTARLDGVGIACPLPPTSPEFPTQTACEFTPPQSAASCSDIKDITALTMVWQGANGVDVVTENGEVFPDVDNGDVITFSTVDGSKDFELTLSGGANGTSQFHLSCSDDDMNGPEDCGKAQGNAKDNDNGFINDWALEGMTGEKGVIDCAVVQGRSDAQVSYGIQVINLNDEQVTVDIKDPKLDLDLMNQEISANSTFELVTDPQLIVPDSSDVFINVVKVTGQTLGGASCDASAAASLTRKPPPPAPVSCSDIKDITELTMVWDGPSGVDIMTSPGQNFENVQNGNQITFNTQGVGNDVELFLSGAVSGVAEFHVSCSDDDMDGSDDCGTNQGNGKNDEAGLINDFLLDGMTGENGSFECGLMNTDVVDPTPGGGGMVMGEATLDLSDDKIKWKLTNHGTQDVFLTNITVSWPPQHEEVKKMKLEGDFAKNIGDTSSPTILPNEKAFESDPNKRKLKKGDDKNLEIEFEEKYKSNSQSDYSIIVTFDNGQTLSLP